MLHDIACLVEVLISAKDDIQPKGGILFNFKWKKMSSILVEFLQTSEERILNTAGPKKNVDLENLV